MKNKKLNIALFICLMLFLSINSMAIGVNDSSLYVTKSEFDSEIAKINTKISNIEPTISNKIIDFYTANPLPYIARNNILIELDGSSNKYKISTNYLNTIETYPPTLLTNVNSWAAIINRTFAQNSFIVLVGTYPESNTSTHYAMARITHGGGVTNYNTNIYCGYGWSTAAIQGPTFFRYVTAGESLRVEVTYVNAVSVIPAGSWRLYICAIN
ncbi:MAG: hypothetical protein Q4F88_06565 [Eubacteriales bacterium]|nr:hypothetical protein [Eubacteriales bacterium]